MSHKLLVAVLHVVAAEIPPAQCAEYERQRPAATAGSAGGGWPCHLIGECRAVALPRLERAVQGDGAVLLRAR